MGARGMASGRSGSMFGSNSVEDSQNKKKKRAKEIIEQPKLKTPKGKNK